MTRRIEWPVLLVLVAMVFNAIGLWPELQPGAPSQSDTAFHALMITQASAALASGSSVVDFWIRQLEFGFPQFLYYQHVPHLFVIGVHRLLGGSVEVLSVFHAVRWLLLVTFPLTVYWSARRLDLSAREAAVAAAASSLLSGDARFGLEYNSYIWRGFGMYTQLWAMHLSIIAVACVYRLMRDGTGYLRSIVVLIVLALSQLLYAYMIALTSVMLLVMGGAPGRWPIRAARLGMIGALSLLATTYMTVPFLSLNAYLSTFPSLPGATGGLSAISAGWASTSLLDHQRWPVLTVLLILGLVVAVWQVAHERLRNKLSLLGGFLLWMLLCFGGDAATSMMRWLGVYGADVSYRFIGGVELFAILLMGVGGGWLWDRIASAAFISGWSSNAGWRVGGGAAIGGVLVLLWLTPAFVERAGYYRTNARWINETRTALRGNIDLQGLLSTIAQEDGGRVYAGRTNNWGANLRVGPIIRVTDVIKSRAMPALVPPYQGLSLNADMAWQFDDGNAAHYDLFDVRYAIVPAGAQVPTFLQPFLATTEYAVLRVATTGASMWVSVSDRRAVSSQRELRIANRDWLQSDAPARRSVIRWDYANDTPGAPAPGAVSRCPQTGTLADDYVGFDSMVVRTRCEDAGTVMFKSSYHPNWRVLVDGNSVATFMVSPAFLAAEVPAGEHEIKAVYVPTAGKSVLLLMGAMVLLIVVFTRDELDRVPRWLTRRLGVSGN